MPCKREPRAKMWVGLKAQKTTHVFPLAGFIWLFNPQYLCKKVLFCFEFGLIRALPIRFALYTRNTKRGGVSSCLVHDVRDVVKMVMLTAVFSLLSVVCFSRPDHTGSVKKAAVSTFCIMLSFLAIGPVVPFPLVSFKGHRGCNEEQGISGFLLTFVSADCSLIAVS